ncbi:MAG TPA: hypothetical protein VMG31_05900 [Verrucomicrobiae bacterium]|nr:hypothetical protein [Verrucomicrobiae bacterium]
MHSAVYNSGIPHRIPRTVNRSGIAGPRLVRIFTLLFAVFIPAVAAEAVDWSVPEQQLARKIIAVTGPGAASLAVENRSSLGKRDRDIVENGLRSAMEGLGLRFVSEEQSSAAIRISLSENSSSYVWVAEIHQGAGEAAVAMVSLPRPDNAGVIGDSVPLTLRKIPLWTQDTPILDVAVLEESAVPTHIAVLDPAKVSLYRWQGGAWQAEQQLPIAHAKPWPRDVRGRLIQARDHLFDVYLPGVFCSSNGSTPLALNCRESDDPWPLTAGATSGGMTVFPSAGLTSGASTVLPQVRAFFAPTRNFFTGVLTPGIGKFAALPKFYSAALLPRDKYTLWLFAATDGQIHMIDGLNDQAANFAWGSDVTSLKTTCGAGWQVLATAAGNGPEDLVRAYEFPDRDPMAVSAALDLPGEITALWTEGKGDTAIAVARNRKSRSYEAYRVAVACNQ